MADEQAKDDAANGEPLPPSLQEALIDKARAKFEEIFDATVIIVPWRDDNGNKTIRIVGLGHPSFWRGMLSDAYDYTFKDED
jgi:hypothetical protein